MTSYDTLRNSVFDAALEIGLVDPSVARWIEDRIPEEPEEENVPVQEMVQTYNFKSMPSSSEEHSAGSRFSDATTAFTSPPRSVSSHETQQSSAKGRGRFLFGFQRHQQPIATEPLPELPNISPEPQELTPEKRSTQKHSKLKKSRRAEAELVVLPDSSTRGRSPSSAHSKKSDKNARSKSRGPSGGDPLKSDEASPDYGFLKTDPGQSNDSDSGKTSGGTIFKRFRSKSRSKSRKRVESPPPLPRGPSTAGTQNPSTSGNKFAPWRKGPPSVASQDSSNLRFVPLELHLHTNSGSSSDTELGSLNIHFPTQPSTTTQVSSTHLRKPSNSAVASQALIQGRITPTLSNGRLARQLSNQGGPIRRGSKRASRGGAMQVVGTGVGRGPSYRRSVLANKAGVGAGARANLASARVISPTFNLPGPKSGSLERKPSQKVADEWIDEEVIPAKTVPPVPAVLATPSAPTLTPAPAPAAPVNTAAQLSQWKFPGSNLPKPVLVQRRPSTSPLTIPPSRLAPPAAGRLSIPSPSGRLRPLSPASNPPASPLPEPPKFLEPATSAQEFIGRALLAPSSPSPSSALPTPTGPPKNPVNEESTWFDDEAETDRSSGFSSNYIVPSPGPGDSSSMGVPPGAIGFASPDRTVAPVLGTVNENDSLPSRQRTGGSSAQFVISNPKRLGSGRVPIQSPPQRIHMQPAMALKQRESLKGPHPPSSINGSNVLREAASIITHPARLAVPQSRPSTAPSSDSRLPISNPMSGRVSPAGSRRNGSDPDNYRPSPSSSPTPYQRGRGMPFPAKPISASSSPLLAPSRMPPGDNVSPLGLNAPSAFGSRPGLPSSPAPSSRPISPPMAAANSSEPADDKWKVARQASLGGIPIRQVERYSNLPLSALLSPSHPGEFTPDRTVTAGTSSSNQLSVPPSAYGGRQSPSTSPVPPLSPARSARSLRPSTAPTASENPGRRMEPISYNHSPSAYRAPSPGLSTSSHGSSTSNHVVNRSHRSSTDPSAMLSVRNRRSGMLLDYQSEPGHDVISQIDALYQSTISAASPAANSQFTPRTEASSYESEDDDEWDDDDEGAHLESVLDAYDDDSETEGMGEGSRIIAAMHGSQGPWPKAGSDNPAAQEKEREERREARERLTRKIHAMNMKEDARMVPPIGRTGSRMI